MKKKAIAMAFNWIFAIIAGGIILFLAIYATTRFIETGEKTINTETSAKLISLLDPLETGLASGKSEEINFKKDSRIYLECDSMSNKPFGKQTIAFSEKSIGDKWSQKSEKINIKNKYVFAEDLLEGKKVYAFSVPFFMPFKISDLIILSSEDYCFYQAPNEIKEEMENLGVKNIKFSDELKDCKGIKVCFGTYNDCDMMVFGDGFSYDSGKVIKENKEIYYTDSLIYSAIFSSSENYECDIKRLMNKFNELSLIYIDEIKTIQLKGCNSNIENSLRIMMDSAKSLQSSRDIIDLSGQAESINSINSDEKANNCGLW